MSYSVFRIQGIKTTGDLVGISKHNKDRISHTNQDIDHSKSKDNITLIECSNYNQKFNNIVAPMKKEHEKRMKTMRSDRVKTFNQHINSSKNDIACEMVFTSDNEFFDNMSKDEIRTWAERSLDFVTKDLGIEKKNILHAVVHMDERTPHLHIVAIPLVKKFNKKRDKEVWSISRRHYISGKQALSAFQDKYNQRMNENGYKLDRGEKGSGKLHTPTIDFKSEKLKEDIKYLEASKSKLEGKIEQLEGCLNEKAIEYKKAIDILDKNTLTMFDIRNMKSEPVMFSSDKVKIDKKDFEKLKDSALKAYTQHNLYATVFDKLKSLEESKEYYKKELDRSIKMRADDYNKLNSELNSLRKENKDLKIDLNNTKVIIRNMSHESKEDFFKTKEKLINLYKSEMQKKSINKNKNYDLER